LDIALIVRRLSDIQHVNVSDEDYRDHLEENFGH
jgi:hypothetical protein